MAAHRRRACLEGPWCAMTSVAFSWVVSDSSLAMGAVARRPSREPRACGEDAFERVWRRVVDGSGLADATERIAHERSMLGTGVGLERAAVFGGRPLAHLNVGLDHPEPLVGPA